jgi:hypothetical protein
MEISSTKPGLMRAEHGDAAALRIEDSLAVGRIAGR